MYSHTLNAVIISGIQKCALSLDVPQTSLSVGATARCRLWHVEKYLSICPYLSSTLSIFSLPTLEDLFLLLLSTLSWVFLFVSSLPVIYVYVYIYIYICIERINRQSRSMRWAGHVARMMERRGVYRVLVGKPEGNYPLGRPRCRWENNIKRNLQEVGCGGTDWVFKYGDLLFVCKGLTLILLTWRIW